MMNCKKRHKTMHSSKRSSISLYLKELAKNSFILHNLLDDEIQKPLVNFSRHFYDENELSHEIPHRELLLGILYSGLLLKFPTIKDPETKDFNVDKTQLIRSFFVHSMMFYKQFLAHKRRLESYQVDSKIQSGFMGLLEIGLKVVQEVAELIIPKQSTKFVQNLTNLFGDHLEQLNRMPTADVPSHSIKVSKYVPSFDIETFLPQNEFDYSKNFRIIRTFSKKVFEMVYIYPFNKET